MVEYYSGDWIRVLHTDYPGSIDVGEVLPIQRVECGDVWLPCKDAPDGLFFLDSEIEPWQPKVGDRVRFTDECKEYWWFGPHTENKEGVIRLDRGADYDFEDGRFEVRTAESFGIVGLKHIEPLPVAAEAQPAALTIAAGKFYKTRDGRRVGPMETMPWTDDEMSVLIDGEARVFSVLGGEHVYGLRELDLIAEWADEPATAPATQVAATASNDNAAPAKPAKFKVGDRVTGRDCCDNPISGTITRVDESDKDIPYSIEGRWCRETDINLASTVAPQQSTAGFTIPLVDDEAANDNTLTVTLALDADDFHEELDEIIAKLKKIRKLQRQTGLAA